MSGSTPPSATPSKIPKLQTNPPISPRSRTPSFYQGTSPQAQSYKEPGSPRQPISFRTSPPSPSPNPAPSTPLTCQSSARSSDVSQKIYSKSDGDSITGSCPASVRHAQQVPTEHWGQGEGDIPRIYVEEAPSAGFGRKISQQEIENALTGLILPAPSNVMDPDTPQQPQPRVESSQRNMMEPLSAPVEASASKRCTDVNVLYTASPLRMESSSSVTPSSLQYRRSPTYLDMYRKQQQYASQMLTGNETMSSFLSSRAEGLYTPRSMALRSSQMMNSWGQPSLEWDFGGNQCHEISTQTSRREIVDRASSSISIKTATSIESLLDNQTKPTSVIFMEQTTEQEETVDEEEEEIASLISDEEELDGNSIENLPTCSCETVLTTSYLAPALEEEPEPNNVSPKSNNSHTDHSSFTETAAPKYNLSSHCAETSLVEITDVMEGEEDYEDDDDILNEQEDKPFFAIRIPPPSQSLSRERIPPAFDIKEPEPEPPLEFVEIMSTRRQPSIIPTTRSSHSSNSFRERVPQVKASYNLSGERVPEVKVSYSSSRERVPEVKASYHLSGERVPEVKVSSSSSRERAPEVKARSRMTLSTNTSTSQSSNGQVVAAAPASAKQSINSNLFKPRERFSQHGTSAPSLQNWQRENLIPKVNISATGDAFEVLPSPVPLSLDDLKQTGWMPEQCNKGSTAAFAVGSHIILHQNRSRNGKNLKSTFQICNSTSFVQGYKVLVNAFARKNLVVTPTLGLIQPHSLATIRVMTHSNAYSHEELSKFRISVKMFRAYCQDLKELRNYYHVLENQHPELIQTKTIDRIIIWNHDDLPEMLDMMNSIPNKEERDTLKGELHRQFSENSMSPDKKSIQQEISSLKMNMVAANQSLRNLFKEITYIRNIITFLTILGFCIFSASYIIPYIMENPEDIAADSEEFSSSSAPEPEPEEQPTDFEEDEEAVPFYRKTLLNMPSVWALFGY